jgi:hypothetical protein
MSIKKKILKEEDSEALFLTIQPNLQVYSLFLHDMGLRKQERGAAVKTKLRI